MGRTDRILRMDGLGVLLSILIYDQDDTFCLNAMIKSII